MVGCFRIHHHIAIRQITGGISPRGEGEHLRGVSGALDGLLGTHEIRRGWVWPNVLPTWVPHVRIG